MAIGAEGSEVESALVLNNKLNKVVISFEKINLNTSIYILFLVKTNFVYV